MPSRKQFVTLALLVAVSCSYQDVGGRIPIRSFHVASVAASPLHIVLTPDDCPTEQVVIDAAVVGRDSRHGADLACLGRLQVGAAVRHEGQKQRQGCVPGSPQYELVGNCTIGPLALTSTGTRCNAPPR